MGIVRLLIIGLAVFLIFRLISRFKATKSGPVSSNDAFRVLGILPGATKAEIKVAYTLKMAEYHPDKVSHLGKELQDLASKKSKEINEAYQTLSE